MSATSEGLTIELDGQPVTLRYTLGASKQIDSHFGNFVEAMRRISHFNFEAFPMVVAAALGKTVKEVEEHVFAVGMDTLHKDLVEYLAWLSNGGKKPNPVQASAEPDSGNV